MGSRRQFVKDSSKSLGLLTLPSLFGDAGNNSPVIFKIVCVGGHPDDPESGCGGTLAKLTAAGHAVTIIYLTTGEAGIPGKSHEAAAAIRKQEAINACKVLNAKPVFAGQVDGNTYFDNEWIVKMNTLIENEKADIVLTQWPVDTHPDHLVASLLSQRAWMHAQKKFLLYFYEVCAGEQTMLFHPTDYVDISETQELKRKAVFCHQSQYPAGIYACGHALMEEFRGRELGVKAAEAFIRMNGRGSGGFISY